MGVQLLIGLLIYIILLTTLTGWLLRYHVQKTKLMIMASKDQVLNRNCGYDSEPNPNGSENQSDPPNHNIQSTVPEK